MHRMRPQGKDVRGSKNVEEEACILANGITRRNCHIRIVGTVGFVMPFSMPAG